MEKKCEKCQKKYESHQHSICYCAGRPECHECGWPYPEEGTWSQCDNFNCYEDSQKIKSLYSIM